MDELTLVRDLLAEEPPPTAARTAAARRRVLGGGRPDWHPNYRRRAVVGLTGAAAVVGVVATMLTVSPAGQLAAPPTGQAPGGPGAALSASQLLLTAADSAGQATATGARWHLSTRNGGQELTTGGYLIDKVSGEELWVPRSAAEPTWRVIQDLGAAPATPADEAAWRRAGSPTSWTVPGRVLTAAERKAVAEKQRLNPGRRVQGPAAPQRVPAAGGAPFAAREDSHGSAGTIANRDRSLAELAALPTDPGRLEAWLRHQLATEPGGPAVGQPVGAQLFDEGLFIAVRLPVSPQVRSAAFRMLAGLPGVRLDGTVRDPLGRAGYGVGMVHKVGGGGVVEDRLVLDRVTGLPLARESVVALAYPKDPHLARVGQLEWYEVVLGAGWTDDRPVLPAKRVGPEDGAG